MLAQACAQQTVPYNTVHLPVGIVCGKLGRIKNRVDVLLDCTVLPETDHMPKNDAFRLLIISVPHSDQRGVICLLYYFGVVADSHLAGLSRPPGTDLRVETNRIKFTLSPE